MKESGRVDKKRELSAKRKEERAGPTLRENSRKLKMVGKESSEGGSLPIGRGGGMRGPED